MAESWKEFAERVKPSCADEFEDDKGHVWIYNDNCSLKFHGPNGQFVALDSPEASLNCPLLDPELTPLPASKSDTLDIPQIERDLAEAQRIIRWLRSCSLPPELPKFPSAREQWNSDVQHYETHLTSNPPKEFK